MEIRDVVWKNLEELSLFRKELIDVYPKNGTVHIKCFTSQVGIPDGTTHFFMQIEQTHEGKIAYLVFIELDEDKRGVGLGEKMYKSVENIARELGCDILRQTASGWTVRGEPRKNYLERKLGYKKINDVEVEKVLNKT